MGGSAVGVVDDTPQIMFEDTMRGKGDGPTVGVILCTAKDETVVKYSVLKENKRLFASRYRLFLPTEDQLRAEVERERALVVREHRAQYGRENGHAST